MKTHFFSFLIKRLDFFQCCMQIILTWYLFRKIVSFSGSFTREVTNIILYALKTKVRNRIQPPRGTVTGAV